MSNELPAPAAPSTLDEALALRHALNSLKAEFEQFRAHLPEAFVEVAFPAMQVSFMNQIALSLLGYTNDDLDEGISAMALVDERSLVEVLAAAAKHMEDSVWSGRPYVRETGQRIFHLVMRRRDGTEFPADVQASYILNPALEPVGVRYIFRDTTDRELAELERARLAALVESSDDAIVSRDLEGRVLSWNNGATRLYGYTAEEMIGQTLEAIEPPGVKGQLAAALNQQLAGDKREIETKRITRDGRVLDVSVSLFPVRDGAGEVVAVGGIGRDIGERIRSAEALKRSNDMLAALSSAQSQFILESNGRVVFEALLASLLELTESEHGFIGEVFERGDGTPYLRTHARTNAAWDPNGQGGDGHEDGELEIANLQTLFGRVMATAAPVISNSLTAEASDGEFPGDAPPLHAFMGLPILVGSKVRGMVGVANRPGGYSDALFRTLQPFLMTCGTLIEAVGVDRARRQAEQRLELAMRGAELALWEWDVQRGGLLATFPEGGSHGFEIGSLGTTLEWWMEYVHPDDRAAMGGAFAMHALGETPSIEVEHRVLNGHGEYRWMLTRGMVVERDASNRPVRGAGTFLDITDRRRIEAERANLEIQMRQSQKLESLGVFAGGIAHDFNNLLTAVLGNLYLLRKEVSGPQAELLNEAQHAAERGAELVRRLLTYARPEVEDSELVHLTPLLAETTSLARSMLTPQTTLVVRRGPTDDAVRGSWTSLQQVLLNLMMNARDAMPDGGTLTVTRRLVNVGPRHRWAAPELPRGRYHMISIADTGHGMSQEVLDRIFDPFYTTKGVGKGSGLGLSTALGIARAHGGWLSVETSMGMGSTFRLLLPVVEPDPTQA